MIKIVLQFWIFALVLSSWSLPGLASSPLNFGAFLSLENKSYEINSTSGESITVYRSKGGYCVKETPFKNFYGKIMTARAFKPGPAFYLHRRSFYLSYGEWFLVDLGVKILAGGGPISLTGVGLWASAEYAIFEYRYRNEIIKAFLQPSHKLSAGDFSTLTENLALRNSNHLYTIQGSSCY